MQLCKEVHKFRSQIFAESTKQTYKSHRDTYLRFCQYMGYPPVPAQPDHLLQYAAFLGRTLKPQSVRSYLNIVGILHKEFGLPNPLHNNWPLKSLLTGMSREKGLTPAQKHPMTPDILIKLRSQLNLDSSLDASFWATCLVAFFGMFRKSHLLPTHANRFDPAKQITKADIRLLHWGTLIVIPGVKQSNSEKGQ